jgi:hypothetical protein
MNLPFWMPFAEYAVNQPFPMAFGAGIREKIER